MADPTAAEMVSSIKATLAKLYVRTAYATTEQDRATTLQDIAKLENSLKDWEARAAAESPSASQKTAMFTRGFCKL